MSWAHASREKKWRVAAALAICLGCSRAERRSSPPDAPPEPRLRVATPTAFGVRATPAGALLGWISSAPGAVSLARFDAGGELVGTVVSSDIGAAHGARDVSLAASEAGAWMAWIESDRAGARARAAAVGSPEPALVLDLGVAWSGSSREARGNLALAELEGGALALARGAPAPCADSPRDECFGFHFYELSASGARGTGVPLEVPVPCSEHAAQLVTEPAGSLRVAPSRAFEYAICTSSGETPVLTLFSIERDRSYAAAQRVLDGCTPLGAGRFAGESVFVAQCGADRRMVTLVDPDRPPRVDDISVRGLICQAGQPRIRLGKGWLGLTAPVDRLELIVGDDLAPRGARVVWTGRALLVVTANAGGLELARYACEGSQLQQLPSPALRS